MYSDIKNFTEEIIKNTGVKFAVFGEDGTFIAGTPVTSPQIPADFTGVISSARYNATLFKLRFRSENYIGSIAGAGKTEKNYAYLVSELAEKDYSKNAPMTREEFFKSVLFGEASYFQITRYAGRFGDDKPACVMIITVENGSPKDVLNVISNYGGDSDVAFLLEDSQCVLINFLDELDGEYRSSTEYAEFLRQSVYEEIGVNINVSVGGTVKTIADLGTSFSQAATVKRMNKSLGAKGGVHSFKEYVLIKMLEDLPKYKLNEYLELLMDEKARDIFGDEEMIATAEEFLEANLNVSETSRKIYLHRNTLMYRLDKIEKATGLNVRKFSDAVTFRLITILSRLVR